MFLSGKNIGKIFAGWDSNYPSSEIKCCQLGQLGAKCLQSTPLTSLMHLTFLTRSLRRSCVFGAIDQLDRFFYFLSVRVEVVNNLARRAYAAGAA